MAKTAPFTLRLSEDLDAWITEEAERTHRSKGAIIEALAGEGARMRRFPGIAFRGPEHDRRAWLIGSALDVWEIVEAYKILGTIERLLDASDLAERQVRLALAYYAAYSAEIDRAIASNRQEQDTWHRQYPTLVPQA